MREIKRCPYCGGKIKAVKFSDYSGHLECAKCYEHFQSFRSNEDEEFAIERFNRFLGK